MHRRIFFIFYGWPLFWRLRFAKQDLKGRERLEKFIGDCVLLGPIRFVCMTDGAILEAVGSFENLRYSNLDKGR